MKLLLLSLLVLQRSAVPVAQQQPATVAGRVVDASTGRPLPGVTVTLSGHTPAPVTLETNSRDDGTFLFPTVPSGPYTLQASRAGYISDNFGDSVEILPGIKSPVTIQLSPGQVRWGVQLNLVPGSVLAGRVTDDRGDSVGGATVMAMKTTFKAGLRDRTIAQRALTNDLGEYRLFKLPAGEYTVAVIDPALSGFSLRPVPDAAPLFYPGTLDPLQAQNLSIGIGETRDALDFVAVPTRTRRVSGVVDGLPFGDGARIILTPRNSAGSMTTNTNPDGTFQFDNVVPGSYNLMARTTSSQAMLPLDVRNADVLNARLRLGSGYRVPVHVSIEGDTGRSSDVENLYFILRPDPVIAGLSPDTYSPFADGRFTPDLLTGTYRLDLTRTEDVYVKSMTLDGVDVLNNGLHVDRSPNGTLEVLIGTSPGSVTGRVEGRDVTVVLVPDVARRGQRPLYKSRNAGSSGAFSFEKVPPGEYKLFAWIEENGGPWLDPEYLKKYEDFGTSVRVDEGQHTIVGSALPTLVR